MRMDRRCGERGIALVVTLLLALMVAGMAIGVILMSSNTNLISRFHSSQAMMEAAADGGLELGRDQLNGSPALLPVVGYVTLASNAPVLDASGAVIPGFTRSIYAGPSGNTTGQYGVFASVISVTDAPRGPVIVRRAELRQDSFSKYARFFNTWTCCMWGNTEVVIGPVHSNQGMAVQTGGRGATFTDSVTIVAASVTNQASGNWNGGLRTNAAVIPFPTVTALNNLRVFATMGSTVVAGYTTATANDPDTRVEFVTKDVNNDGDVQDADEGFFLVWKVTSGGTQVDKRKYVSARRWLNMPTGTITSATDDPNLISPNCGGTWNGDWWTADSIYAKEAGTAANKTAAVRTALTSPTRRCFPGGDPRLNTDSAFQVSNAYGNYIAYPGAVDPTVQSRFPTEAPYLWPISRAINPNFKGVIFVNGSVAVSGVVRGRVTLVATGNIILADDISYVTPPGTTCVDILGLLTTNNAVIEDNSINTPFRVNNVWRVQFDDTPNETFQSFMLTLGNFNGENIGGDPNPVAPENCGHKSRGCKSIIGGTIQQGVSGTFTGSSGWAEQDTYDKCGRSDPPPYFPTTGRFSKSRYYEMDPVGFNVANWYAANQ